MKFWNDIKQQNFIDDMQKVFDCYGIHTAVQMTAGYDMDGRFAVVAPQLYMWTATARDQKDAEEQILRGLLDKALADGDWETCRTIHRKLYPVTRKPKIRCADCGDVLTDKYAVCRQCEKPMCAECYADADGVCVDCKYGTRRMI